MNANEQVSVVVMGREFAVSTPVSEKATLMQSVDMLNKKIEAVESSGRIVETDRIIILAALNVVHDLLKISMKDGLAIGEFESRITNMVDVCDKVLTKVT